LPPGINQTHPLPLTSPPPLPSSPQAQREAHAAQLMGVLSSLWGAMDMPAACPDRAVFVRMMTSPLRLHQKSLEKVGGWAGGWVGGAICHPTTARAGGGSR
jgi:hypothetical protein